MPLQDEVVSVVDEGPQDLRDHLGMIVRGERVANIVEQRTDDLLRAALVVVGARRRLQAMVIAVDREAAEIALQQAEVRDQVIADLVRDLSLALGNGLEVIDRRVLKIIEVAH